MCCLLSVHIIYLLITIDLYFHGLEQLFTDLRMQKVNLQGSQMVKTDMTAKHLTSIAFVGISDQDVLHNQQLEIPSSSVYVPS